MTGFAVDDYNGHLAENPIENAVPEQHDVNAQAGTQRQDPQPKGPMLRYLTGALILLAFAVFVEAFIGWAALLAPWKTLQLAPLAGAIILVFLTYALRALRIYDYFRADIRGRFAPCLRLSLQHNLLNNLLPMRTGEISFPLLMSRYFDIAPLRSVPTLLWFRLLDLHTLLAGGLLIAGDRLFGRESSLLLATAWMILPWLTYRLYRPLTQALSRHPGRVQKFAASALQGLPHQPGLFWRSWLWTLCNWTVKLAVFAWVLNLFADTGFAAAWVGATAGDLTSVLPIHGVAGAGTYEAGVVAGLLPFEIDAANALQAAVNLHLFVLGCTLLSGLLSLALPGAGRR